MQLSLNHKATTLGRTAGCLLVSGLLLAGCASDRIIVDRKGLNEAQYLKDLNECQVYADEIKVGQRAAETETDQPSVTAALGQGPQRSEGGAQISIRGGMTEEGMLLTGQIHYVGNGTTAEFRGLWTPLEDGRVRQFFEQSGDGGESWSPWFEGFYTRRSTETIE